MKRICALAMLALLFGMLCAGGPAGVYADGAEAVSSVSAGLKRGSASDRDAFCRPNSGRKPDVRGGGSIIRLLALPFKALS